MKAFSKKAMIIGVALLILLSTATAVVLQKELDIGNVFRAIFQTNIYWLLPGALAMILFCLSESMNIYRGLKLSGAKPKKTDLIRYALAGFFFSGITPSASGGQPAQLFYMNRDDIKVSQGTFSLLLSLLSFEIAAVVIGVVGTCVSFGRVFVNLDTFRGALWLLLVGASFNLLIILGILSLILSQKAADIITKILVFLCRKVLKMKDVSMITNNISEYRRASETLKNNQKVFLKMLATSFIQLLVYHSIPFFCCRAMGCTSITWFEALCLQGMLFISVSSLPLPGAAGITEGGFALLFSGFLTAKMTGSVMVLSRSISFVLPLFFSGILLFILNVISDFKRRKRDRRNG